jgi:hypothetical protein
MTTVRYHPHADAHDRKNYPALWVTAHFMNLLLAGVLGFVSLHTILWFVRSSLGMQEDEKDSAMKEDEEEGSDGPDQHNSD